MHIKPENFVFKVGRYNEMSAVDVAEIYSCDGRNDRAAHNPNGSPCPIYILWGGGRGGPLPGSYLGVG